MTVRTPLTIIAVLTALLIAGSALAGGGGGRKKHAAGSAVAAVAAEVRRIAHRDEVIRGLRFRSIPEPQLVTPAQARKAGLADFTRTTSPREQAADSRLLQLLGLVPAGTTLRSLESSIYGGQVAGYYDPRTKRIAIVTGHGAGAAGGAVAEITLSHELNHALEDQHFGLHEEAAGTDDGSAAYSALIEGTATEVMTRYALRYIGPGRSLSSAVGALGADDGTGNLPRYILASLLFPYESGQRFVEALYRLGGWKLVNLAERTRPPLSTELVIHPEKWLRVEVPRPVPMPPAGALGRAWRRVVAGTLGEFDTDQILKLANPALAAGDAAAGWGGGRYEMWSRGGRDALLLRWTWDTPRDERQFVAAARRYAASRPGAALSVRGGLTTIAFGAARTLAAR